MDDLFNGFQRFLGSFTSLQMDDVVRLVFEILVILILLAVLHIPFRMISSLGSSLLHSVAGFGIGSLLAAIWKFIIGVAYVAIFVVVLVNLCTKRLNRYRSHSRNGEGASVFDDFKESFDFDQAKKTVHSFTNDRSTRRETVYDERDDIKYQERDTQRGETDDEYEDESMYEEPRRREYRRSYEGDHMERGVTSVATILMRIFFCLMMIPFVGIIVALCCALGAMIVLSFEGLTLFGAYFIVIGALVATGGFLSLLYSVLWGRHMKKFLISLIVGITMMAIGTTMLVFEIKEFEFVDGRSAYYGSDTVKTQTFRVKDQDLNIVFEDDYYTGYEWKYDESMKDEVRIEYTSDMQVKTNGNTMIIEERYNHEWGVNDGMDFLNTFLDGLKQRKVYTMDYRDNVVIVSSSQMRDRVHVISD